MSPAAATAEGAGAGTTPLRVVLVDDHPVVRAGLSAVLSSTGEIAVVAEAGSHAEALALLTGSGGPLAGAAPDLLVVDLHLGEGPDGAALLRDLGERGVTVPVLVLTAHDTGDDVLRAVEAGAVGYLLKDAPPAALRDGVRQAAAGETVLAPRAAAALVQGRRGRTPAPAPPPLTGREVDVLRAVGRGLTNRQVARELGIREATVKTHLVHAYSSLGAVNRTDAVRRAREHGLLD
ncbi:two component transcriptional regulator, LuxR family [Kytococcus aerolatus]|uniref:Two component transcriptional regulator, LuxR family n=1 Tax=Kytococcus aerolatus TaxID=592308 RepID=A0A212U5Z5_9MICO|nr:response regulator transcription factor [Kytococcus aerolatus]SNC73570.1 two component transcriptional regulator, LuxR family [Kytococcus aerolatus]